MQKISSTWTSLQPLPIAEWTCGYCNVRVSARHGYYTEWGSGVLQPRIYPCPNCGCPSFFWDGQHPGSRPGDDLKHLPIDVERMYNQARDCCRIRAYDAAALIARSLLMYIAIEKGASKDQTFVQYVDYLEAKHYIPPDSKEWVDHVRKQGNRAAHELSEIAQGEAEELIGLVELILRYTFEFPGQARQRKSIT